MRCELSRPRIGVTTGVNPENPVGGREFYMPYAEAVKKADGAPVYLDPKPLDSTRLAEIVNSIDGLLLTGGKDVDPSFYNARNEPGDELLSDEELLKVYQMDCDPERDAFEIQLIDAAYEARIPIFGICRGLQVLNVALGGGLVKDIRTNRKHWSIRKSEADEGEPGASRNHLVTVISGTKVADIIGDCPMMVNSRHHQGVTSRQKSELLRASAVSPDGFIEAVEATDHPWAIAVQWHPERAVDDYIYQPSQPLFTSFVSAAAESRMSKALS